MEILVCLLLSFFFFVDDRFPPDATVEFVFSNCPEKMKGKFCHVSVIHCTTLTVVYVTILASYKKINRSHFLH